MSLLLYAASALLALALLHQFFSVFRGGSEPHIRVGRFAMACGIVIALLVTIRGSALETWSAAYIAHLAVGFPFFVSLFLTGWTGSRARTDRRYAHWHQLLAMLTAVLLVFTLVLGIFSRLLHA